MLMVIFTHAAASLRPLLRTAYLLHPRAGWRGDRCAVAARGIRLLSSWRPEDGSPDDGDHDSAADPPPDEMLFEPDDGGAAPLPVGIARRGAPLQGGHVYFVSTPIGNLEDVTLRAIRTLDEADVVASEDTRVTATLLHHFGVRRKRLIAHHEHNLGRSIPLILQALAANESVALVTDAGTPGISDPGAALAAKCVENGFGLVAVPGPCAAVAALSVSGLDAREWTFFGFVPRGGRARRQKLAEVVAERRACVLYEAPHRIVSTLRGLADAGAARRTCVCARELTKRYEESYRGEVQQAADHWAALAAREGRVRGEFTLVLGPMEAAAAAALDDDAREEHAARVSELLAAQLGEGASVSRAAKSVATTLGVPKSKVYAEALRLHAGLKGEENDGHGG